MLQYIDGPCGWSLTAPVELRRVARGGASAWHDYTTSHFLGGSHSEVVRTTSFPDLPFESGMQIELLTARLASSLRKTGFEFASVEDMNATGFQGAFSTALDLIRTVPPLLGTVAGLCRSLHVIVASESDLDASFSDPSLPFSVFVSCPPPRARWREERLAENIVHEALHLQLSLVESAEPLVIDGRSDTRLFSPWKNEPRTVQGLLHGVYVFGNLRYFWSRIAHEATEYSTFAERRIEEIDSELTTVEHLSAHPALTAMGRHLATTMLGSPSRAGPRRDAVL